MTTPANPAAYRPVDDDEWLVIIDPQAIFASPSTSAWGSPLWADVEPRVVALAEAFGRERTVVTRFVADPGLGGSWGSYYEEWGFALVPDDDPLYAVVPTLRSAAGHGVTAAHGSMVGDVLLVGEQLLGKAAEGHEIEQVGLEQRAAVAVGDEDGGGGGRLRKRVQITRADEGRRCAEKGERCVGQRDDAFAGRGSAHGDGLRTYYVRRVGLVPPVRSGRFSARR